MWIAGSIPYRIVKDGIPECLPSADLSCKFIRGKTVPSFDFGQKLSASSSVERLSRPLISVRNFPYVPTGSSCIDTFPLPLLLLHDTDIDTATEAATNPAKDVPFLNMILKNSYYDFKLKRRKTI